MSTYVEVNGRVRADEAAFCAFLTGPAAPWLDVDRRGGREVRGNRVTEVGPYSVKVDSSLLTAVAHDDGSFWITAEGGFRNLGRYLPVAVADAATAGQVEGAFDITCTDGSTYREVIAVAVGTVLNGTAGCLNEAVTIGVGERITFPHHLVAFDDPDDPVARVGAASQNPWCGCGGWDDDNDRPLCEGEPDATAPSIEAFLPAAADSQITDIGPVLIELLDGADAELRGGIGRLCAAGLANGDRSWLRELDAWAQAHPWPRGRELAITFQPRGLVGATRTQAGGHPVPCRNGQDLYLITRPRRKAERLEVGAEHDGEEEVVVVAGLARDVTAVAVTLAEDGMDGTDALAAAVALITGTGARP